MRSANLFASLDAKQFARKVGKIFCMRTRGQIVGEWMAFRDLKPLDVAKAVGTSRQNIENLVADKVKNPAYLHALAKYMGYATVEGLIDLQDPPVASENPVNYSRSQAHRMSHARPTIARQKIEWGDMVDEEKLPMRFELQMRDESMAPLIKRGEWGVFRKLPPGTLPEAGKRYVVVDKTGEPFLRECRVRRPGQWEAHALVDAHLPLDSEIDGLRVVAIMTGINWED